MYVMAISFLGGGNQEYPEKATYTHCKSNYKKKLYQVHFVMWGIAFTVLVMTGTDSIGRCKSNYHWIGATITLSIYQKKKHTK
jgi:uncharacterized protein (DUF486 family)